MKDKTQNENMTTNTRTLSDFIECFAPSGAGLPCVYRPDAMVKWLPPNGFTGKVHHLDAKVGGTYKMSFTNFTTGSSHSFGGAYLELKPGECIKHTDKLTTRLAAAKW